MKPCSNQRKDIALLAAGVLGTRRESAVRAHLETCERCRGYFEEVSSVTQKLSATEIRSDIHASAGFHHRVVNALKAEEKGAIVSQLRAGLLNWRWAVPALAAITVLIVTMSFFSGHHQVPSPPPTGGRSMVTSVKREIDPTISNYQMIANRSLEQLDEVLNRQANRNPAPTAIYTASMLERGSLLD